jgi:hypothetical protein
MHLGYVTPRTSHTGHTDLPVWIDSQGFPHVGALEKC